MSPDELIDYEPEDGEWEEGVVYVDEDGNEFTVEFVYEDETEATAEDRDAPEIADEPASTEADADATDSTDAVHGTSESAESDSENPFMYEAVQQTTDAANQIYREGASTMNDLAAAGQEMKETLNDIKEMFDFKSWLK